MLDLLELESLRDRDVGVLSGGERQRLALARALCSGPELLLLDEPLASLDLSLRRRILPYLLRVREEFGIPMVFVSHDATEVRMLCDEIVALDRGRVINRGRPAEVLAELAVSGGDVVPVYANLISGEIIGLERGTARLAVGGEELIAIPSAGLASGDRVWIEVSSEDIVLATAKPHSISARNVIPGVIRELKRSEGDYRLAMVAVGKLEEPIGVGLTELAARDLELAPASKVYLVFKTLSCHPSRQIP